jgi:hypothetical protein
MFASKWRGTVIAKGLKIVGSFTVEGLVELKVKSKARSIARHLLCLARLKL